MQYRINVREKVGNFIRQKKMVAHIRSALIAWNKDHKCNIVKKIPQNKTKSIHF